MRAELCSNSKEDLMNGNPQHKPDELKPSGAHVQLELPLHQATTGAVFAPQIMPATTAADTPVDEDSSRYDAWNDLGPQFRRTKR